MQIMHSVQRRSSRSVFRRHKFAMFTAEDLNDLYSIIIHFEQREPNIKLNNEKIILVVKTLRSHVSLNVGDEYFMHHLSTTNLNELWYIADVSLAWWRGDIVDFIGKNWTSEILFLPPEDKIRISKPPWMLFLLSVFLKTSHRIDMPFARVTYGKKSPRM